ncbi:MAG: DUF1298 domain-containing protein [Actinobacteria bacterium]|nr:DUF1298 domain-containing protein [Actinomycetota bacterium]
MAEFMRNSDAFAWSMEHDPRLRSTIVSIVLLDRAPDWQHMVDRFDRISRIVPMFRQRVLPSPMLAPPRWESAPDFDLEFHVRRVAVPADLERGEESPPGERARREREFVLGMARVAAMADFDRARPLWEVTLIEGFAGGGAALLCKLHHALTDGIGAVEIARNLYDSTARLRDLPPLPDAPAAAAAGPLDTVRDTLTYQAGLAVTAVTGALAAVPALVGNVRHPVGAATAAWNAAASIYRTMRPLTRPGSPIMRDRTLRRRVGTHEVPKDLLQRAGHAGGGSINDAFLAAVAGGIRLYHEKHDVGVGDLIVTMPISLRTDDDPIGGNRVTLMRFGVPAAIADAAQRIRAVHQQTGAVRGEKSLPYTQLIAGALNVMPRWYVGSVLCNVDVVASDVPGFPAPVYLSGSKVLGQFAFAPTIGAAVNVTLLSYADTCELGVNADAGAIPDFDVFLECLAAGFDEVLALARPPRDARPG